MARTYLTPLPLTLSLLKLEEAEVALKLKGVFKELPEELQQRWDAAGKGWSSITIVKAELDMIPDGPWDLIAPVIGVQWVDIPPGAVIHK